MNYFLIIVQLLIEDCVVFTARRVLVKAKIQRLVELLTHLGAHGLFTMTDASLQKAKNLASSKLMAPQKRFHY